MSLKFRNSQGIETPVAGLNGQNGSLVPSVSLYQRGTITNTATITSKSYERIEVTLSTPMPDADYVVDLQTMQGDGLANAFCDAYGKTKNGFAIILANPSDNEVPANLIQVVWRAFKLMTDTVHEADSARIAQNTANFAPAFSEVTSYAVGDYVTYDSVLHRCTTAHTAGTWVAGHFTAVTVGGDLSAIVPSDASASNKLVTKASEVFQFKGAIADDATDAYVKSLIGKVGCVYYYRVNGNATAFPEIFFGDLEVVRPLNNLILQTYRGFNGSIPYIYQRRSIDIGASWSAWEMLVSASTLKSVVASSTDFADFKTKVAAL